MRRENEEQLLRLYHSLLLENGVHEYAFEQCWDDYRLAMLLPAARIAVAVGLAKPRPMVGVSGTSSSRDIAKRSRTSRWPNC